MSVLEQLCCCPCYPVWYRSVIGSSSGGPGELTIRRSPLFGWNQVDPTQHAPIPQFIGVKILPPENASSGGIDGPRSPLDNRVFDVELVPDLSTINDADPQATLCNNFLWYCGRHALNMTVPKLDGTGTVKVVELKILVLMNVQDWDYRNECRYPRFIVETYLFASTDESGEGGSIYAGSRSTGGPGTVTSIDDGWLTTILQPLGYPQGPPSGTGAISFPPLYNPDLPILVSPRIQASSDGPYEYQYPMRNRRVLLQCTPRKKLPDVQKCDGDEEPPEPPSSSYTGSTSYDFSTSGGASTSGGGGTSGGSSGGGSTSGGGSDPELIHPRLCGTGAFQTDLFVDFIGKDDGQVYLHSDGRCVYLDLQGAETVEGTENLDTSTPLAGCYITCPNAEGHTFDDLPTTGGFLTYVVERVVCNANCVEYECDQLVAFDVPTPPPEYIEITEGNCAGTRFRLIDQ